MKKNDSIVKDLLKDVSARQALKDFDIEDATEEQQVEFITSLGDNIQQSIVIEIARVLPESAMDEYTNFVGSGDLEGLKNFLTKHIPDLDNFMQRAAKAQYDATLARLREEQN
jgi:hypothetical protein